MFSFRYAADQRGYSRWLSYSTIACVTAIGPARPERFETIGRVGEERPAGSGSIARGLVILAKDNQKRQP